MHVHLARIAESIARATSGMDDHQLQRTRNGKWSAAQIIEHLSLAFGATAVGLARAASADTLQVRPPTFRERLVTLLVVTFGYIPNGRKAPEYTVPAGLPPEQAFKKLHQNLAAMDAAITLAEQRWGRGRVGLHPILGPLTPDQWRKFHWVHARHHAKQILAIRRDATAGSQSAAA
jgi:hypothetical protein